MPRKLFALNIEAHGHVNPTLPLTRELVARGVDVVYCVPPSFAAAIQGTGARHIPYESQLITKHARELKDESADVFATFALRLVEEAETLLPQLLEILKEERPDALIFDNMCLAGLLAAKILNIPTMGFRPSYVANEHFSLGRQMFEQHGESSYQAAAEERLAKLVDRYQVEGGPRTILETLERDELLNLVFLPRAFQPCGDTFNASNAFVGPQIAPRPEAGSFVPPPGDDPLVFVSLGTLFNDWLEFFHIVFEAFGGKKWRVVVAIGDKVDTDKLGLIPSNVVVQRHVPQLEVLPHASVFVTHGGMNSVQESIWYGVPMVVIPQMIEQAQSAKRVAALEMGRSFLEREAVNVHSLSEAVAEVASDAKYRTQVLAMREHSKEAGGFKRAADLIEAELAKHV